MATIGKEKSVIETERVSGVEGEVSYRRPVNRVEQAGITIDDEETKMALEQVKANIHSQEIQAGSKVSGEEDTVTVQRLFPGDNRRQQEFLQGNQKQRLEMVINDKLVNSNFKLEQSNAVIEAMSKNFMNN